MNANDMRNMLIKNDAEMRYTVIGPTEIFIQRKVALTKLACYTYMCLIGEQREAKRRIMCNYVQFKLLGGQENGIKI